MGLAYKISNVLSLGLLGVVRSYFDAASYNRLNRDFRPQLGHFELQASRDRAILVANARKLSANNPICKSIDNAIIKNVVGTGITLQSKIDENTLKNSKNFNDEIEKLFKEWSKPANIDITNRFSLTQMLKNILKAKMVDGEILINCIWTKDKKFPLKLQLLEADMLDLSLVTYGENDVFSGVEVDSYGKPVAYHIKTKFNSNESKRFEAKNIIHFYDPDRVSQYRGITDYSQVIETLKDFQAYNDAEIKKNRTLASMNIFLKSKDIASNIFGDKQKGQNLGYDTPIKEVSSGMIHYLNHNDEVITVQSNQLGSNYEPFIKHTVRLISAGRDISYELAIKDYSQVNFSSARASLIQDNKKFDYEQKLLVEKILNPIFELFLDSQVLSGNIKPPKDYTLNKDDYLKPVWIMPTREWVNPLQDIKALEYELKLGLTTLTRASAQRGRDFEEILRERLDEEKEIIKKRKKAGLPVETEEDNI